MEGPQAYRVHWLYLSMGFPDFFFFFQAEDGIRDSSVTGVQTCALPISASSRSLKTRAPGCSAISSSSCQLPCPAIERMVTGREKYFKSLPLPLNFAETVKIGRASCRERV